VEWFQGWILRGDQFVVEEVDGCMRTKPVPNAPWASRIATHAEQMGVTPRNGKNCTLRVAVFEEYLESYGCIGSN
jgi:hypothetical protein